MTSSSSSSFRLLYIINDPPSKLFEKYNGLPGMVRTAFTKMKNSPKYKHLFPTQVLGNIEQIDIDEVHPYKHRFEFEKALQSFPTVPFMFDVSSAEVEQENSTENKKTKKLNRKYDCVLLSGSLYNASDKEPWANAEAKWLKEILATKQYPVLGVCFGHQLLGQEIFGGVCRNHELDGEWGSYKIKFLKEAENDPVLGSLAAFSPDGITCNITHGQSVREVKFLNQHMRPKKDDDDDEDDGKKANESLFPLLLGSSEYEPVHLVRYNELTYGFQPHPEYPSSYVSEVITEADGEEVAKTCTFQNAEDDFSAALLVNFFAFARSM